MEMGAPIDWSSSAQTASGQSHLEDFILRLKDLILMNILIQNQIIAI